MKVSAKAWGDLLNRKGQRGFTLIEILVVMTIIGILMALVIGVAGPVQQQARVYRARGEVAGFETALTRFETDNGFVPTSIAISTNGGYYAGDPLTGSYENAAKALFLAISGRHYYWHTGTNVGPNYFPTMKESQVYNPNPSPTEPSGQLSDNFSTYEVALTGDYLMDPWGNPYGFYYATNSTNHSLFNQVTYDLWSTAGETSNPSGTNDFISKRWAANWANQ